MGVVYRLDAELMDLDNDPLVRRLQSLEWVDVPSEVRARCWERLNERMAAMRDRAPLKPAATARETGDRYEFTRRSGQARLSVAEAWSRRVAVAPVRPLMSA